MKMKSTISAISIMLIFLTTATFIACNKTAISAGTGDQIKLTRLNLNSAFSITPPFSPHATYYIPQGGIADHSDPTVTGSIAWYFATKGRNNIFILSSQGVYYNLNNTITLPDSSTLSGSDTISANWKLSANSGLDNKTMVKMGSYCTLQNLYINGVRKASTIVSLKSTMNATVSNCTIFNSKNNFTVAQGNAYTILINGQSSTNAVIQSNILRRAGSGPKAGDAAQTSMGYAMILWSAVNATVQNNNIASTLTCGIDITGASTAAIAYNTLDSTGLNRIYSYGAIADAITGYHNWNPNPENFSINNNVINNSQNHGIHVSGLNLNIHDNTITNQQLSGVMVDDWRNDSKGTNEYSSNIVINNNKCTDPLSWTWQPGNSNRKIYVDRVDSTQTLNYNYNLDNSGVLLPVNSSNYHFPTLFGPHVQ